MLKLRKILLYDYLYLSIFILVFLISLLRLNINHKSIYNTNSTQTEGIVTNLIQQDNTLKITLKSKEKILLVYDLKEKEKLAIELGDKIKVIGTFQEPEENTTNYLFNYKKYLQLKKIYYQVIGKKIIILRKNKNKYYYLKQKIINRMNKNAYLHTFILGDKTYIDSKTKRSFQENGISHLFAISGMHITLLVKLIEKILRKLKKETIFKITSTILIFYLMLVGLSPSILRGILFYLFYSLNKIYYFYIKPLNIYLLIISISLLINPSYLLDIGFEYSYLISLALIKLSNNLQSKNYIISILKVSILSFIVSIPITLYNFYQLNLLSIIYNIFYVPLISIIIFPLSLIIFIIKPLAPIYNILILFLEKSSILLSNISLGKLLFKRLPIIIYIIYFLLIIIFILKNKKIYLTILLIILSIHYLIPYFDPSDYIKVIDIGQGDCILLHSNNKSILIDTGGTTSYNNSKDGMIYYHKILPLLKSEGIKKLELLIITHGDKDHLGEAKEIVNTYKIDKILLNSNKINYFERKLIMPKTSSIAYQGTSFKVGDFYFIQLNEDLIDENDSSQIYLLQYKNKKILLTGDASIKSEKKLLENYNLGNIDILKVGHHGSKTSTSEILLQQTRPKIALISSGRENRFNHPHQETINKLEKYHVKIYNTKINGTITINLNSNKILTDKK